MSALFETSMNMFVRTLRVLLAGMLALACAAAWSDEAAIRKNWNLHNPKGPPIDEVAKTPIAGLYELRVGGDIVYSDESANYLIYPSRDVTDGRLPDGHLLDTRTKTDLTDQRLQKILEKEVPRLPFGDALVFKQGTGARRCPA